MTDSRRSSRASSRSDLPPKNYIFIVAAIAALNSCNLGYDIGVSAAVGPLLIDQPASAAVRLSDVQLELFIGTLDLASLVGAAGSHYLADKFGRRGCMGMSAVLFIFSVLGMSIAQGYISLMFFRFMTGIGVGVGLAIGPLYIGELAPEDFRGKLVSWTELATNIGILLGFGSGYVFHDLPREVGWRVMLGLGTVMPTVLFISLAFMPESPRWLMRRNSVGDAHDVLSKIYHDDVDVGEIVDEIQEAIYQADQEEVEGGGGWTAFTNPSSSMRLALIAGIGMAMIQQLSGIEAITSYFVFILDATGIEGDQYFYLVLFGVSKLITVYFAGSLFDSPDYGRKKLLLISIGGILISFIWFFGLFAGFTPTAKWSVIGSLFFYVIMYSVGVGPGTWVVCAEIFPLQIRAKAVAATTFMNRIVATFLSGSFLTLIALLGYGGFFFMFVIISFSCLLFIYFLVPETQGVSLERMNELFLVVDAPPELESPRASAASNNHHNHQNHHQHLHQQGNHTLANAGEKRDMGSGSGGSNGGGGAGSISASAAATAGSNAVRMSRVDSERAGILEEGGGIGGSSVRDGAAGGGAGVGGRTTRSGGLAYSSIPTSGE